MWPADHVTQQTPSTMLPRAVPSASRMLLPPSLSCESTAEPAIDTWAVSRTPTGRRRWAGAATACYRRGEDHEPDHQGADHFNDDCHHQRAQRAPG
jgi:hypothetical protein